MLKVRRTMTEILLNVTNRHIEAICKEELQRYTKKYKGISGIRRSNVIKQSKLIKIVFNSQLILKGKFLLFPNFCFVMFLFVRFLTGCVKFV